MLIQLKTSFKSTFILLLLMAGGSLNSNSSTIKICLFEGTIPDYSIILSPDTTTTIIPIQITDNDSVIEFQIPKELINEKIDFQINSDISYLSFNHFKNEESQKAFVQAWRKEKEVKKITSATDSLRKAYINSLEDRKADISAQILAAERRQITLNLEIPELYEKARTEERQYWQSAPVEEKMKFERKILHFRDSVQHLSQINPGKKPLLNPNIPDTITIYKALPEEVEKLDVNSGITYRILIGAYKNKMADSAAKAIKKLSLLRKVDNYIDEKGIKVYTTGNLKKYEEAVIMQNQVKHEGIKNAFITAYHNGKRIPLDEAKKLNNEPITP